MKVYVVLYKEYAVDEVDSTVLHGVFDSRLLADLYVESAEIEPHAYIHQCFKIIESELNKELK